jgi:nucleoid DNA-binding protein
MRKIDIAHTIANKTGLTQFKTEQVVDVILEAIKANLSRGEPVMLRRFGTFEVRAKPAREGRNPKTGQPAEIAARKVVSHVVLPLPSSPHVESTTRRRTPTRETRSQPPLPVGVSIHRLHARSIPCQAPGAISL